MQVLRNTLNRDRISPTLFCTILFYGWDKPTGYIDGEFRPVYGEFDNYLIVSVKPSITLEGDDSIEVCLYKNGKKVASTYPDFLFDPICLEYNGEEYHIQLKKECEEKKTKLRYTEDYF